MLAELFVTSSKRLPIVGYIQTGNIAA